MPSLLRRLPVLICLPASTRLKRGLSCGFLALLTTSMMTLLSPYTARAQVQTGQAQLDLARVRLQAGMHMIDAQLAQTPLQRQIGLMWRREMPEHEGMLFVFEQPAVQCFWMRNTLIPLTAAFLHDDGRIESLANMQPRSDDSHCSGRPVRYVLEMNQGWFEKRGLRAGARITGGPFGR